MGFPLSDTAQPQPKQAFVFFPLSTIVEMAVISISKYGIKSINHDKNRPFLHFDTKQEVLLILTSFYFSLLVKLGAASSGHITVSQLYL